MCDEETTDGEKVAVWEEERRQAEWRRRGERLSAGYKYNISISAGSSSNWY